MAADLSEIIAAAEKLGQLVAAHPAIAKYKDAQKAVASDSEASKMMTEFGTTLETLARQEQSGMPMSDAQRQKLELLQMNIASNLKIKALNIAEVDFTDLLRKVSQAWQRPVAGPGAAAAGGSPLRM